MEKPCKKPCKNHGNKPCKNHVKNHGKNAIGKNLQTKSSLRQFLFCDLFILKENCGDLNTGKI